MIKVVNVYKVGSKQKFEYVGRSVHGEPSPLGNKFKSGNRVNDIADYRVWLHKQIVARNPEVIAELSRLKAIAKKGDLLLGCFCAPRACHADIIKSAIKWAIQKG
jgi:hypothetical protein